MQFVIHFVHPEPPVATHQLLLQSLLSTEHHQLQVAVAVALHADTETEKSQQMDFLFTCTINLKEGKDHSHRTI